MPEIESIRREDFDTGLAWLAGFIDGEGCFYLGFNTAYDRGFPRKTLRTLLLAGNTMPYPIEKATNILKEHGVGFTVGLSKETGNPKWSRALNIKICGQGRVLKICNLLLPYLSCKNEQAKQMIYAIEYRQKLAIIAGGNNKNTALVNDPILRSMSERMKELNAFRPDLTAYTRQAGEPIYIKKPSTTIRLTAIKADDIVCSA